MINFIAYFNIIFFIFRGMFLFFIVYLITYLKVFFCIKIRSQFITNYISPRIMYKGTCQEAILGQIHFPIFNFNIELNFTFLGSTSLMFADDIHFYNHEANKKKVIKNIKNLNFLKGWYKLDKLANSKCLKQNTFLAL